MQYLTSTFLLRTLGIFFIGILCLPSPLLALTTSYLADVATRGDFLIRPGKIELTLAPGEETTVVLSISNRTGDDREFFVAVEDIEGSKDLSKEAVTILESTPGAYSIRNIVRPEVTDFKLGASEEALMSVRVNVPSDAEPGGRYGTVLISAGPKTDGTAADQTAVIGRIGVLFFVRVQGDMREEGMLRDFTVAGGAFRFSNKPPQFNLLFENNGNVHLNPYGYITLTNMVGTIVGKQTIEPWFVLPNSLRLREILSSENLFTGLYTAHIALNRGYDDVIDEKTVRFVVLPLPLFLIVGGLMALAFVALIRRRVTPHAI